MAFAIIYDFFQTIRLIETMIVSLIDYKNDR